MSHSIAELVNDLRAVLCDPEVRCCIEGSDADRKIVDNALATLKAAQGGVTEAMVERMAAARWEVSRATPWDKVQPEVRQDEIAQMRAALDVVSSQAALSAEPAAHGACRICGESEPRTGTCGSSDPRALCNQARSVTFPVQPAGEVDWKPRVEGCEVGPTEIRWYDEEPPTGTKIYTAPPAQPAERVPEELRVLSERASTDWKVDDRKIGGGAVVGGPVFHYTNGSGQTQVATFSCPRQDDDDPRDPTVVQNANARFAVECVNYVRGLLAASPAPSPARTIYDHRVRVDEACHDAAPRLYSALKNLLDAVKERPDNMGIESVVTGDAENALLAASPARGDGGEG